MATIAGAHIVLYRLDFLDIAAGFKVFKNCFAGFKSCHSRIFAAVKHFRLILRCLAASDNFVCRFLICLAGHMAVIGKGADDRQIVPEANFKVVRVVSRGDFNNTGAFGHIRMLVTNNGNFLIEQRQNNMTAVKMRITRIFAVDCNGSIAEHCFGAGCGKLKLFTGFLNRVKQMPKV